MSEIIADLMFENNISCKTCLLFSHMWSEETGLLESEVFDVLDRWNRNYDYDADMPF